MLATYRNRFAARTRFPRECRRQRRGAALRLSEQYVVDQATRQGDFHIAVLAGGEAQRRIDDRIHSGQLAETLGHEGARTVVQKRRIGMASQARHHGIALMAARADGVEHLVLDPQHARHQVQVPRDQLRFEQLEKTPGIERAARQHRLGPARRGMRRAPPQSHKFEEVLIDHLGTVETLVAEK